MKTLFRCLLAVVCALSPSLHAQDASKDNARFRVACVGDSITQGSGAERGKSYPSQLQELLGKDWNVGNFGVSGRTLLKKGDRPYWNENAYKNALAMAPHVVIIMLGTNDTKPQNWKFESEFSQDYAALVQSFQDLPSKPRIFVCRPCPVPGKGNFGINDKNLQVVIQRVDQLAKEQKLGVIDMHKALVDHPELLPDRVHPNTAGAALMAKAASEALLPLAKELK
jgi:acyl-CoA thioesterase I